ncbi:MAG: Alanine-tRNA ligase, eukaryota/bacteria [Gemmatimonadetes bacterium]|nr:Alanine-tRNA ligase, eukaryota/bacteria [Gemmatimonadota bacterium]
MRSSDIRRRFLDYFAQQQHVVRPSSSLVPADDPTLLFVNAGMVPFKKVFLGMEEPADGKRRATTAQKCVRAGGKHNDLEQVGHTARHHTFFEMLGNFSFGDYFKRDAIRFAWDLITSENQLAIDPSLLRVTVHYSDDEAFALWQEIAGLPPERIYRLGDADNFWQMADTGPCGPCTEIYVDLAKVADDFRFPPGATGEWTDLDRADFSHDAFVEGAESGRFLEIWNLVFMQFDKQPDGTLKPLPKPSVDTGAGLERIAAVKQKVTNNFHTDGFLSLIKTVEDTVGFSYWGRQSDEHRTGVRVAGAKDGGVVQNAVDPASFRVVADHARSVAFLLADGVFPSNEGRGYVLRRILRRAVRHAYLLGRREPTLVNVVQTVIDEMGDVYPELKSRSEHLIQTTRVEEQAFLATIEGGLSRFEQLAPLHTTQGGDAIRGTISGEDAFRLYDTFGFPIDLTELMAHERGYGVDIPGFEAALLEQRTRSKDERKTRKLGVTADALGDVASWDRSGDSVDSRFVGYDTIEIQSEVVALRHLDSDRVAVLLRESPFYAESGGQISDEGEIVGDGWRIDVDGVRKVEGRSAALGKLSGEFHWGPATARVPSDRRRDTERNHTATHLMHSALREVLGDAVHQAGSLVAPDRLRFDFTHHGPVKAEKLAEVEAIVNREIWRALPVTWSEMPYPDARAKGAMALFGEKYGDVVRVVDVPGVSMELCGGTHVRNTSEIGLFVILGETGVASGVRRIEALTGPGAFAQLRSREDSLMRVAELVKSPVDSVEKRVQQLLDERRTLDKKLEEAMRGGGDELAKLLAAGQAIGGNGARLVMGEVAVGDAKALQAMGDALREQLKSGVGLLAAKLEDGKGSLLVVVTDDLREQGVRADAIVRDVAAVAGGRGGGKPHMAQAGLPDASRIAEALAAAPALVTKAVTGA